MWMFLMVVVVFRVLKSENGNLGHWILLSCCGWVMEITGLSKMDKLYVICN